MNVTVSVRQHPERPEFFCVFDLSRVVGSTLPYRDWINLPKQHRLIEDKMYLHFDALLLLAERSAARGGTIFPSKMLRFTNLARQRTCAPTAIPAQSRSSNDLLGWISACQEATRGLTHNQQAKIARRSGVPLKYVELAATGKLAAAYRSGQVVPRWEVLSKLLATARAST